MTKEKEVYKDLKTSDVLIIIALLSLQNLLNISNMVFGILCGIYVLYVIFIATKGDWKVFLKRAIPIILIAVIINIIFS